jgi:CRP-like cAMP-binding protein
VIDTLHPGSAINYRAVLMRDQMYINLTAVTEVKLLTITLDRLMALVTKHSDGGRQGISEAERKMRE